MAKNPKMACLPQKVFHASRTTTTPNSAATTKRRIAFLTAAKMNAPAMKPMTNRGISVYIIIRGKFFGNEYSWALFKLLIARELQLGRPLSPTFTEPLPATKIDAEESCGPDKEPFRGAPVDVNGPDVIMGPEVMRPVAGSTGVCCCGPEALREFDADNGPDAGFVPVPPPLTLNSALRPSGPE